MSAVRPARVRVKICGLTNARDALAAVEAGADALGFNLFPGSKRFIALEEHAGWIKDLPPFVAKVAVLVNAPLDHARWVAEHPAIDLVQFHGDEDENYCAEFARSGRPFLKALRLNPEQPRISADGYSTRHLLIDAYAAGVYGGTGSGIDLAEAANFVARHRGFQVVLAGGLTPGNVAGAIRAVAPYGVDVASGVETGPREKSPGLISSFFEAVGAGGGAMAPFL